MQALGRLIPSVLSSVRSTVFHVAAGFHGLGGTTSVPLVPGGLFALAVRNNIRVHFPRPSERKRILRHGWKKRMSTPAGRRVLMNRILKGRHVYSH